MKKSRLFPAINKKSLKEFNRLPYARQVRQYSPRIVVFIIAAILGLHFLHAGLAATFATSQEAEGGSLSGASSIVSSSNASGSKYVTFGSATAAAFPSVLHASNGHLLDSNNYTLPLMKGFNVQVVPWSQTNYNSMAQEGAKFQRLAIFWDRLQGSDCSSLSATGASTYVSAIDTSLARAQAAGIYSEIDLHILSIHMPACATTEFDNFDDYMKHGQWITQYLAQRYGNPSSPQYTKDAVGFGLNEPPPYTTSWTLPNNENTLMEQQQSIMLSWIRGTNGSGGIAPQWVGFVAYDWASHTPIFNANPGQNTQCTSCSNANPHAYDGVGGNVILDVHSYMMGCTSDWSSQAGSPPADTCDGRQFNGDSYSLEYHGGWEIGTGDPSYPSYPPTGVSETTALQQMKNSVYPYQLFSQQSGWPWMVGEFAWSSSVNTTGGDNYMNDKMTAWDANNPPAIEMWWDYDVNVNQEMFAAAPGGTFQPVVNTWFAGN